MKKLLIAFSLSLPLLSIAQPAKQKLSRDSIRYYQQQLQVLRKITYDSMVNSREYKEITQKLYPNGVNNVSKFGVEFIFFTGLQINTYSGLNDRLTSLGVKKRKTAALPIGVGLAFRINKVIVGYDLSGITPNNGSGFYGHFYVSTNEIRSKRWIFSPQIGLGWQGTTLRIQTQSTSTDFDSYFTTSANQVELNHSNSVLDFALAFKLTPKNRNEYIPLFRVGYRYGLKEKAWEVVKGNSTNAPTDRNSDFYVQLLLGLGD